MFFLLAVWLLPLVASTPVDQSSRNYILDIDNGTLRNIQLVAGAGSTLDLSGLGLHTLQKNAFDNVSDAESLDLSDNSFTSLPDFIFSNLTRLTNLSLASNRISNVRHLFTSQQNLELLDISYNPIRHLRRGHLFGLTKSVRIIANRNIFWSISTDIFENAFLKNDDDVKRLAYNQNRNFIKESNEMLRDAVVRHDMEANISYQRRRFTQTLNKDTRVKLCKSADGIVTSLQVLISSGALVYGCVLVPINVEKQQIILREQGIRGFRDNWYKMQLLPVASLDLSNNEITEITRETLNHLPADLNYISFLGNRIRQIKRQVIQNKYMHILNFKDNLIDVIEDGALANTSLRGLFLSGNQLDNLNFVSSLPGTLNELTLSDNRIVSIPDGAFDKLFYLDFMDLDGNKIETLRNDVFRGLGSLKQLVLSNNSIAKIEPSAFKGLNALRVLHLYHNSITSLQDGMFAEMTALKEMNLAWNKIANTSFVQLPRSVDILHLDYNEIEVLRESSFVRAPKFMLSFTGNKISHVAHGAFDLPSLRDLYLNNNTLTSIDGDSYEGLPHLRRLWLSENNISEIRKGSCKHLGNLVILDISKNPFEKLENGALYGLSTARGSSLYIYENHLKEIQGGIFQDV